MKKRTGICLAAAFTLSFYPSPHMMRTDDPPETRREKLRMVLRIADLRVSGDSLFREMLYDRDTVVRQRAVAACGSIQDTALLPDLLNNLTDSPLPVQEAAAFAIGQTAQELSPGARERLAHDIVHDRLARSGATGRMIEELGKFGDNQALEDLLLGFGNETGMERRALLMGIARFAIRKITTPAAVKFSLGALFSNGPDAWVAAYALQRIGEHGENYDAANRLIGQIHHGDPLVRMNLATLFGKLTSDSALVGPLAGMAGSDADWRVRVNALKAMGNFPQDARTIESIRTALASGNPSVTITALTVFGGISDSSAAENPGLSALGEKVTDLALNEKREYPWQIQVEAAKALARRGGESALEFLRVPAEPVRHLKSGMIGALGATGSAKAVGEISMFLDDEDPLIARSALEALHGVAVRNPENAALRERAFASDIRALAGSDMAVITTAASNLGDTLFTGMSSVRALVAALENLRPPADIEPIQEICRTLSGMKDTTAVRALEELLEGEDAAASRAAAGALSAITGRDFGGRLPRDRTPLHTDFDFGYLEALPDTIRVKIGTDGGDILIDLYRDAAPFTIMSILRLAEEKGFYRGLIFHPVVPNFVIQGGVPRGDGWGGPGYSLRSEFSQLTYTSGTVGIASAGKDTEGCQFFITHSPQPHLDGRYTIIGRVVSGMEVVDGVQVGDRISDLTRVR